MDRSILEVYCGGAALTDRLYPDPSATGLDLYAEGRVWPTSGRLLRGRYAAPRVTETTLRSSNQDGSTATL